MLSSTPRFPTKGRLTWASMGKAAHWALAALLCSFRMFATAPVAPEKLPRARSAFRGYGVEQGLLNLAIQCMAQDKAGFLWVGTEEGLFRYDGERFKRYGLEEGLPSTYIDQIALTPDGGLWVATQGGLARLGGDRFVTVTKEDGLPKAWIRDVVIDGQGVVWAGTDEGLFRSVASGKFASVPGWSGGECTAVALGREGAIYAAGSRGLEYKDVHGGWSILGPKDGLGSDRIDAILLDPKNALWVRSNFHLWVRESGASRFQPRDAGLSRGVTRGRLLLGAKGSIWVPTNLGLAHWNADTNKWDLLNTSNGLPSNLVGAAFEDREGSIWAGAAGLYRWLGRGLWSSYAQREGLPSDVIWCIFRDHRGQLWVGTDQGLCRAGEGGWSMLPESRGHAIRRVAETADGKLWMGGSPLELLLFDPRSGRVDRFGPASGLRGKRLMSVLVDRSGELWVAADGGGLMKAVKSAKTPGGWRFEPVDLPQGTPTEDIRSLAQDGEGRVWAAGEFGLACLDAGRWRRYTTKDGLLKDYVSYLDVPAAGGIRFAYFEPLGISRARIENGAFRIVEHLGTAQGLQPGKVYLMGEDVHGRLWVGSGHGVDLVEADGVRHISQTDGLPGDDCDANAFHADRDGDVWIGTSAGLARFDGSAEAMAAPPPNPVLLSLRLGQQEISAPFGSGVEVPHKDGTLEVHFAGLSFLNEAQVRHQVRLLELEPQWRNTDVREARYPALPPGRYTFEVRAQQGGGPWSKVASFSFRVLPAWWQTWWFRIFALLAGGGLVALLVRWRIASLHRHNRELERLVSERTGQLSKTNQALEDKQQVLQEQSKTIQGTNRNLQMEIHRRIQAEAVEDERRRFLERILQGAPLVTLLRDLAEMTERQLPNGLCSILTLPDQHLFHGGGSERLNLDADGQGSLEAGGDEFAGSHDLSQVQVIEDITRDPFWKSHRTLGVLQGLKCCWFLPILSGNQTLLGFFNVHHSASRAPQASDINVMVAMNGLAALVIEHRKLTAELAHQAQYDALTNLPNRFLFRDRLTQALALARRSSAAIGLLFLDLDGFKRINDTLGHHAGDQVLVEVSRRLTAFLRQSDTFARMGGDEFTMILMSIKEAPDLARVAQKILDALREPMTICEQEVAVGASIGISVFPEDAEDEEQMQRHADAAMYRAKALGKNGFQFFTANVNEEVLVRLELENHLRRSLELNELQLFYQPQYRGKDHLVGFEALLRWNHPKLGMIPPARFIPIAEESGIILSIGAWVLEQACRQMSSWAQAGFQNLTMAVNVSMIQFERRDWADSVEQVLKTTGLNPSSLELELTESVVMRNAKEAATRLNQLRKLGVRLAIDDFGTGYSSLNYLQQLPIDTLKIDQSFIENLHPGGPQDSSSEAIVRAIIALAKSMDLGLIAEGVETEWQEDFLRKHGCEGMQGFLFARPMPPEACEALLRSL